MPGKAEQSTANNAPTHTAWNAVVLQQNTLSTGAEVDALQPSLQDNVTATKENSNDVCMRHDPKEGDCWSDTLNTDCKGPPEDQLRGRDGTGNTRHRTCREREGRERGGVSRRDRQYRSASW
jgi:hypothetical protein